MITSDYFQTAAIVWHRPRRELWVANRRGDYAGMIERGPLGFDTIDGHGRLLGIFPDLAEAQSAIEAPIAA